MTDDRPLSEVIELRGHIIDSYILPAIMDEVMDRGGEFDVEQINVGRRKDEPSYARIRLSAPTRELLDLLLTVRTPRRGPGGGRARAAWSPPRRPRLPRRLLLDHEPGHRSAGGRRMGAGAVP